MNLQLLAKLVVLGTLTIAGCFGSDGPSRYDLSGSVSWQGKPVPRGFIVFSPDTQQGNSGPGTNAEIVDGKYATIPQRGTIGGPHIATISGFDGQPYLDNGVQVPHGKPLFDEQQQVVDLPKTPSEHDFNLTDSTSAN